MDPLSSAPGPLGGCAQSGAGGGGHCAGTAGMMAWQRHRGIRVATLPAWDSPDAPASLSSYKRGTEVFEIVPK